jgi:phosphotransferase system HPr-like phosphotransfer protein
MVCTRVRLRCSRKQQRTSRANICLHKQQAQANAKSLVAIMALQTALTTTCSSVRSAKMQMLQSIALTRLLVEGCGETVTAVAPAETHH